MKLNEILNYIESRINENVVECVCHSYKKVNTFCEVCGSKENF